MTTIFSAYSQGLGYLYQTLYALLYLLKSREETEMSLETLDDVVIEEDGNPRELLEFKHHINAAATLTDISPELWKTIRIWSTYIQENKLSDFDLILTLITTAKASENSICSSFLPNKIRDIKVLRNRLVEIANTSKNKSLENAFSSFLSLSQQQQEHLISAIQIIDGSPFIVDISKEIKSALVGIRPRHKDNVYERLEGWWFDVAIHHLFDENKIPITKRMVEDKLASINEQFQPDALPIDFFNKCPTNEYMLDCENRLFVLQLQAIMVGSNRIEKAILDYYRAFQQRSQWTRENLLEDDELENYERKLIDEWERYYLVLKDEPDYDETTEESCVNIGKSVYKWMDQVANIHIRKFVTEEYVMRGSYHILADQEPPRIWWHPKFVERLEQLLKVS